MFQKKIAEKAVISSSRFKIEKRLSRLSVAQIKKIFSAKQAEELIKLQNDLPKIREELREILPDIRQALVRDQLVEIFMVFIEDVYSTNEVRSLLLTPKGRGLVCSILNQSRLLNMQHNAGAYEKMVARIQRGLSGQSPARLFVSEELVAEINKEGEGYPKNKEIYSLKDYCDDRKNRQGNPYRKVFKMEIPDRKMEYKILKKFYEELEQREKGLRHVLESLLSKIAKKIPGARFVGELSVASVKTLESLGNKIFFKNTINKKLLEEKGLTEVLKNLNAYFDIVSGGNLVLAAPKDVLKELAAGLRAQKIQSKAQRNILFEIIDSFKKKQIGDITDLLRMDVVVWHYEDIAKILPLVKKEVEGRILEINNKFAQSDLKKPYKDIQLIIKLDDNFCYELQIKTLTDFVLGGIEHDLIYKNKYHLPEKEWNNLKDMLHKIYWVLQCLDLYDYNSYLYETYSS